MNQGKEVLSQEDKIACKQSAVNEAQIIHGSKGQLVSQKPGALMLIAAAYVMGGGGMLAWLAFLLLGPPVPWDFNLGIASGLLLNTLLSLLFFTQHSIMVRRWFRLRLTRSIRSDFHGVLYASASGICLLILVGFWQPVGSVLWEPPGWFRWAMMATFPAAGAGALWGLRSLGNFDALGVKPALEALGGRRSTGPGAFMARGPYRWVRHPLYLFSLIIIWFGPIFTIDRLGHNILWTVWIIIGTAMEERDLIDCFGDAYRSYRKEVPMLLPRSLKPLKETM